MIGAKMLRTTVEFSDEAAQVLERSAKGLDKTKSEVLRSALSLYSFLAEELKPGTGRQIGIIDRNGKVVKILVLPEFATASRTSAY
jgi:hypothetical protein